MVESTETELRLEPIVGALQRPNRWEMVVTSAGDVDCGAAS
jgi:hypothetical protein